MLLLLGLFAGVLCCSNEAPKNMSYEQEVEYYEYIINCNVDEASTYVLPVNNEYFLEHSNSAPNFDGGQYDFIIVGAGSAGSALAYGLSENENWNILLVEGGGDEDDFSVIPEFYQYLIYSDMNWGYSSIPQKHSCLGMENDECAYPRGKVIGGSGTINAMIYVRGNRNDFDSWAEAGNPGWAYKDVLPYFIGEETSHIDGDPLYHGMNGPITISYSSPPNPFVKPFIDANLALGRKVVDYNGREQLGVARTQLFEKHGYHVNGGNAFLDKIKSRKNLRIVKNTLVTRILISKNKTAYGIEYINNGKKGLSMATKEVIVSAGAVNSPQLLMLSGIGPKKELEELGIKVIQDLQVGKNLQDHPTYFSLIFQTNYSVISPPTKKMIEEYLHGRGPYTSTNDDAMAFSRLEHSTLPEGVPDLQLILIPPNCTSDYFPSAIKASNLSKKVFWDKVDPINSFRINVALLHPRSKGTVKLASKNPLDFPLIDLNFLAVEQDTNDTYQGILQAFEIANAKPFRDINATYVNTNIPECDAHGRLTREYWYCNLKYFTTTGYHPCCTAKMGPETDKDSVVDARLKVHGVDRLRVVDASIFPNIVSGNTNAGSFMVGGKAADIVNKDYNL